MASRNQSWLIVVAVMVVSISLGRLKRIPRKAYTNDIERERERKNT